MRVWLVWLACLAVAAGKGKKHKHNKPGRAVLDRLSSTVVEDSIVLESRPGSLVPAPLDVAPYSEVLANATCGDAGAEEYCRDTPGKRGIVCDVCEGLDGSSSRRHPAAHAVDGDPSTWWQSPTLEAGDYQTVEFVAVLPDKMELLHVIIKSGPSPRPLAWSLEVSSSEAEEWRMIKAFGDREHCRRLWDLRPERRRRKARGVKRTNRADKPVCSTQFASPRPLENGEMHIAIGEGVTARRLRISFRAPHALPPRQQYYSVRALTVAARCLCHGHAQRCRLDAQGAKCECEHGTCGAHCERCCSGATWAPHAPCAGTECSCGPRGACSYDDTGAILCVNCTENRAGPLCDRCLFGYFNAVPDGPCLPCECDPQGSDGSCKWDKRHHRRTCSCLPGYSGAQCDSCEDPSAQFPDCQSVPECKCDPRGIVDPNGVCDDVCKCKEHVVGERCDTCASGYFGLSAAAAGCTRCYCSRRGLSCTVDTEPHTHTDINLPLGTSWLITNSYGNDTLEPSVDEQGNPFVISYEVEGWEYFYWLTKSFNGDQLSMYGGDLRASLYWGIVRGDTGGTPTYGPDLIIIGADGTKLSSTNTSHETPGLLEITTPLLEGSWMLHGEEQAATRDQLLDVLRDVKGLMIKAHYHFDQDEVRLEGAGIVQVSGRAVRRERCACGAPHSGAHCQRCAAVHVRVGDHCEPCPCHSHAECDSVEGPCGPCQHNTTGPHCERCLPGHYGNPVQGACKPCACPLYSAPNNFSPNCALAGPDGDEYVCTQCPEGYAGDHCEICEAGYWGSPAAVGGACARCACGGGPCDAAGRCLSCPPYTEGARCHLCKEGYRFGPDSTPSLPSCIPCECGAGSLSVACEADSGQCACRTGWSGRACDHCEEGYGGISAGCPACRCGLAAVNTTCDPISGACQCAPGAAPPSCDSCVEEHYGLNVTGCLGCNCSSIGSESNVCDIRTGQCRCKQHATGRACDTCEEGYWGLQLGGCRRCTCGPGASACDPVTGACACAEGVGGTHCDVCLPGYYGFGPAGCLPCPICTDGKVCSPQSGRCVCPAGSLGAGCRQCAKGYRPHGDTCKLCSCGQGALSTACDPHTGQCKCKSGYEGPTCEQCAKGHYGPKCRPCQCNLAGTKGCEDGVCECDEIGRCPCKENVVGEKCDECLSGTFGLSADSPVGCTACFCFGRVSRCSQATLSRAALHAASPLHLTLQRAHTDVITNMDQDSLLALHTHTPDATITLPWPPVPVYVELDTRFVGDRVTSYGGSLRYTVEEEGGVPLSDDVMHRFPLVRLYTKNIVLEYFEHDPNPSGSHVARLHESLWRVRGASERGRSTRGPRASRAALMLALTRLDKILVRVTTRAPTREEKVHALLLNVSLDTAIPGLSRSEPALGVELCACPEGYTSSSCQKPAVGFWMPPPKVHITSVQGTIVINLEGDAQPCNCNNRAMHCDPDTGACLNCTGGTGGPRCAECAAGHYGTPGGPGGCQACPCPSRAKNFASACIVTDGIVQCLCKPGYAGSSCSDCASGYRRDGAACVPCGCGHGASGPHCDRDGRCQCREFATGDRCDMCTAPRTFMERHGCSPCDNCTQTLMDSVEALTSKLHAEVDINELSRVPKPFAALREYSTNVTAFKNDLQLYRIAIKEAKNLANLIASLESDEHKIFTEANGLKNNAKLREKVTEYLSLESMSGLEEVLKLRRRLSEVVEGLDEFARGEKHLTAHRALKEARHLLKQIRDVDVGHYVTGANDVFETAHLQSTSVQERDYRLQATLRKLQELRATLNSWEEKAADLHKLADVVWTADDSVGGLKERVVPKLAAVRDIGLRCRLVLEDITTLSAHNITDEVRSSILQAQGLAIKFPGLTAELKALTLAAEEKEGILYNLTPAYKEKYLQAVQKHVEELGVKAKEYKSLFAGARSAASLGITAAQAWSEVTAAVRAAAVTAVQAERAAATARALTRGDAPLSETAERSREVAAELKLRGAEVKGRAEELQSQLWGLSRGADWTRVSLRALGWQERALSARPSAHLHHALSHSHTLADRVFASARVLYDEAAELRRKLRYDLRRRLQDMMRDGDTKLGAAEEHVSQIRGNTVRGATLAAALDAAARARARQHASASLTLAPALTHLQEKVARARHTADAISVSLTSVWGGKGCARAYSVWAASPAVTRVALTLSFDNVVDDGPLLYLQDDSEETERYMKLSVVNRKLHMSWNLGAGEGLIFHPEELQPTHDDADHTSYRIEIERVWSTVHLRVELAGRTIVSASNSSATHAVALYSSRLWLGWPHGPGLPACVHALYTDDKTMGLWNFVQQPKEAECTGCTQRWYRRGSEALSWTNGAGYVELVRSGSRPTDVKQFSVAFTFRTRDEDALLFMALDKANNRSISVTLQSCRVVFTVQYGAARLSITAPGRHCTGRPAHVQASRVFVHQLEKGSLRVNGEETLGSPAPPVTRAAALPALSAAPYWLAGAPPGAPTPVPGAPAPPPLLGCIGAVTVDRTGYDLLQAHSRHGVEPGCGERTLRSAIFKGSGYIELPSPGLKRKAALGLSFRTRDKDGLLLLRTPGNDSHDKCYLALVLVEGELAVAASAGKDELRLKTNGTRFDDGRLHTVRLVRAHKQLELWVDSERQGVGPLLGSACPPRPGGLLLGGPGDQAGTVAVPLKPFTGTIADFIVDAQLIGLQTAVSWRGAALGRADGHVPGAPHAPRALHQADAAGCTKSASFTVEGGAVKFGDSPHSHVTLTLREGSLQLQLRTFATRGLLLLLQGTKAKPKQFLALVLRDGKLRVVLRARRRRDVTLPTYIADGVWRTVSVRVSGARVQVSCAGASRTLRAGGAARGPRLYIGGLPHPPPPGLPNKLVREGGFVGCVRRVRVGGRPQDLVRDARQHHAVGQCFPNVEKAAYFGGDAYAVWSSSWSMSSEGTEVSLMFRSHEGQGVLLAGRGVLLQLHEGAVVLSLTSGRGARVPGPFCDGRWHALRARLHPRGLRVSLDAGPEQRPAPVADLLEGPVQAPGPLYIAGLPEGVIETEGGKNFNGCIKDVMIGGAMKNWTDMESLHNVLQDSCPIPQ